MRNALAMCPEKNLFCAAFLNASLCFLDTPCLLAKDDILLMLPSFVLVISNINVIMARPITSAKASTSSRKKYSANITINDPRNDDKKLNILKNMLASISLTSR